MVEFQKEGNEIFTESLRQTDWLTKLQTDHRKLSQMTIQGLFKRKFMRKAYCFWFNTEESWITPSVSEAEAGLFDIHLDIMHTLMPENTFHS